MVLMIIDIDLVVVVVIVSNYIISKKRGRYHVKRTAWTRGSNKDKGVVLRPSILTEALTSVPLLTLTTVSTKRINNNMIR
jgi:hypothetical protein